MINLYDTAFYAHVILLFACIPVIGYYAWIFADGDDYDRVDEVFSLLAVWFATYAMMYLFFRVMEVLAIGA